MYIGYRNVVTITVVASSAEDPLSDRLFCAFQRP
jgi:hypothetical protein